MKGNNQVRIFRRIIRVTAQRMNWRGESLEVRKWVIKLMQYRPWTVAETKGVEIKCRQTLKLEQALFFFFSPSKQLFSLSTDESRPRKPSLHWWHTFPCFRTFSPPLLPREKNQGDSSSPTRAGGDGGRHFYPPQGQGQKTENTPASQRASGINSSSVLDS